MIETKQLCATSSNFVDIIAIVIDFGGQRSNMKVTIGMYGNNLVNKIET